MKSRTLLTLCVSGEAIYICNNDRSGLDADEPCLLKSAERSRDDFPDGPNS